MTKEMIHPSDVHVAPDHILACKVGNTVYIGGHGASGPDGKLVGKGDMEAQATQAFTNLGNILKAAGAGLADIVKLNIYLTEREHLLKMVEVRKKFFAERNALLPPGRTTVIVKSLGDPDSLIEIEGIAEID